MLNKIFWHIYVVIVSVATVYIGAKYFGQPYSSIDCCIFMFVSFSSIFAGVVKAMESWYK